MRVAAVDCGTNSIRLLVADIDPVAGRAVDVVRIMRTVRLGEGIDTTKEFSDAALTRTFDACQEYADLIGELRVAGVRFVATSASRDARNREVFAAGVQRIFGVGPEVISGQEEAHLTFHGALGTHAAVIGNRVVLVVDIGGGSTEFVRGVAVPEPTVQAAYSADIGCVRMTERHLRSNPPTPAEIAVATADIDAAILAADRVVDLRRTDIIVGLAGSVTTVAAMAYNMEQYDSTRIDGCSLDQSQIDHVASDLLAWSYDQRAALPFMHPGRVDVIAGGALVLQRIAHFVGKETLVSEHDILDGIAWSVATRQSSR